VSLRVSVEEQQCELVGYCSRIAPEVFDTDSSDVAKVLRETVDDPDLTASVLEAEATCPTAAITAIEG
jgi:ferredoxin